MATTAKKVKKSYPRVEKTGRINDIIAIAKKHDIGMTAPVATEYDKLSTLAVIEKRVIRDAAIMKLFGRKSISKKLAVDSVKGKLDKAQKK